MKRGPCRQIEEVLAHRDAGTDAVLVASMQQHLQSCPACRRHQRTWALVQEKALETNDVLDDLTRARVFGRVQARLGAQAAGEDGLRRRPSPMRTRLGWSLGFAAVAMLAFALGTRLRKPEPGLAVTPVALEPYALHVPTEPRSALSGKGLDHVELPPHASMRARLGRAADLTLLGPLALTVRDSEKQRVELELERGTLLAEFDGSGGRSLRISTANATVDIVGTRFIVDASATRTRVAVDHGLVRVESKGRLRVVGSGRSWNTDDDALAPLDEGTARMFDRAALGRWEELAAEPPAEPPAQPPTHDEKDKKATEGPPSGEKATGPTRPDTGVRRGAGVERPARQRRVHVRRTPSPADVAGGRLALAVTPQPSTRATVPTPTATAPLEDAAPPLQDAAPVPAPSPAAAPPAASVAPVPPPPAVSRATVSSLYKEAEQALRRGDDGVGRQRLVDLVRSFPRDVMADAARFELALLANKDGDQRQTLALIRDILGHGPNGALVEPARFLRCRVYLKEDRDAAETCLVRFVRDYPRSPHDEVAVRALIELARAKGQCSKASQLAETYLQRHPKGSFADEAARVRSHCGE